MSKQFRLFPRGFLGGNISPHVVKSPRPYSEAVLTHQYTINFHNDTGNSIEPNPEAENVYAAYIKNINITGDFKFKRRVLVLALNAFGTMNFYEWYKLQFRSLSAGDLHNRFLTDTIRFLQTGRRDMSIENWTEILTISDEGDKIGMPTREIRDFFGLTGYDFTEDAKTNDSLLSVIALWCSKPNGFDDLIGTLHILFGDV